MIQNIFRIKQVRPFHFFLYFCLLCSYIGEVNKFVLKKYGKKPVSLLSFFPQSRWTNDAPLQHKFQLNTLCIMTVYVIRISINLTNFYVTNNPCMTIVDVKSTFRRHFNFTSQILSIERSYV